MDDALFQAVARYFLKYTENYRYLETLESIEEEIARYRLLVIPVMKLLE